MSSPRKQIADALAPLLPDTYVIWPYPKGNVQPGNEVALVIERRTITPADTTATYDETYYVWVLTGVEDEEVAEDELDDALEIVQDAFAGVTWCTVPTATRDMYGDLHGWRLETQIKTTKESPE